MNDPRRSSKRGGLGTKLVENFAKQLGARHEIVSSETGHDARLRHSRRSIKLHPAALGPVMAV